MSDVKRYAMCGYGNGLIASDDGHLVGWDDYAALEAERGVLDALCQERFDEIAALRAELAALKAPAVTGDEREAFEAWYERTFGARAFSRNVDHSYQEPETEMLWAGWQARATRPAQTEQLPVPGFILCYTGVPACWHVKPEDMPAPVAQTEQQPVGWKLVPVVPTQGMINAAMAGADCDLPYPYAHDAITASIAAAPIAQTPAGKVVAKMPCGAVVTNVYEAYEAGKKVPADGLVEALEATNQLLRTKRHACENPQVCHVLDIHIERNRAALAAHRAGGDNE